MIIVDTKGLLDNSSQYQSYNYYNEIYQSIFSFIDKFAEYQVQKIYFCLTECLENSTIQISKNFPLLYEVLGSKGLESSIVLYTKYNPQLENVQYLKTRNEERIKSIQNEIRQFEQQKGQNFYIKSMKFHTHIDSISSQSQSFFKEKEQKLFSNLQQIKSFNTEILQKFENFCNERIKELSETEGVGVVIQKEVLLGKQIQTKTIQRRTGPRIYGLFGPRKLQYHDVQVEVEVPVGTIERSVPMRSEAEIRNLFFTDDNYLTEKEEKLQQLFEQL